MRKVILTTLVFSFFLTLVAHAQTPAVKFKLESSTGTDTVWFDEDGNLVCTGNFSPGVTCAQTGFRGSKVYSSTGTVLATMDAETGDVCIAGACHQNVSSFPADKRFVVRDGSGNVVACIDDSGEMYLKGYRTNDPDAPIPNPMQWATAPYATSSSTIIMTAVQASDPDEGIMYYFEETSNPTTINSGWVSERTWTATALSAETTYTFRVRARDVYDNKTEWSRALPAKTLPFIENIPEGSAKPVSGELGSDLALSVDPFTGSVKYSIPIAVPPGRQGSEPKIALNYGGGGNGWCGVGWSLSMGAISRDTRKGVPVERDGSSFKNQYDDDKGFVVAFGAVNSRLVLISEETDVPREYRAETDQAFLKYEYYPADNQWVVTDKSGNKFWFGEIEGEYTGETAGAVMIHPQFVGRDSLVPGDNTFGWALAYIQDINGNKTYVYYYQDILDDPEQRQVYLKEIRYNGHVENHPLPDGSPITCTSFVKFELESNEGTLVERDDKTFSYATGYRIENNYRLNDIRVEVDGQHVRRYHLEYEPSPSTLKSLLQSVQMYGTDDSTALPAVTFDYTQKPFGFERDAAGNPVIRRWGPTLMQHTGNEWNSSSASTSANTLSDGVSPCTQNYITMADINGDGLPDRVMAASNPHSETAFLVQYNTGSGFSSELSEWGPIERVPQESLARAPYLISDGYLGDITKHSDLVSLMDINGDGRIDRLLHRDTSRGEISSPAPGIAPYWRWPGGPEYQYLPANNENYFWVQFNTGLGFERNGPGPGGGTDFVLQKWGPLDAQGWTGAYPAPPDIPVSSDWWWADTYTYNSPTMSIDVIGGGSRSSFGMMDLNGDGLPDRIMQRIPAAPPYGTATYDPASSDNYFLVQLNTGQGFARTHSGTTGGGADFETVAWGPVWANGYTGTDNAGINNNSLSLTDVSMVTHWSMLDLNGDGLVDRVWADTANKRFKVQFGTGYGFERDSHQLGGGDDFNVREFGPLHSQGRTGNDWNSLNARYPVGTGLTATHVLMMDINGDGLPDRVMRHTNDSAPMGVYMIELNTGSGFTHQINGNDIAWEGVHCFSGGSGPMDIGWTCPEFELVYAGGSSRYNYTSMADVNGDGLVDRIIVGDQADGFHVQLNQGPIPDMLCKVTGSLGGTAEVEYTPSTEFDNRDHEGKHCLPMPVYTATSVTIDDQMGHRGTTHYEYARGFFDGQAREFRGFGKVTVIAPSDSDLNAGSFNDLTGTKTVTYFHQGGGYDDTGRGEYLDEDSIAKKGMPYRVEIYGYDENLEQYQLYALTLNKVEEVEVQNQTGWYHSFVSQTTKLDYTAVDFNPSEPVYSEQYRAKVRQSLYDIGTWDDGDGIPTGNILTSIDIGEVRLGENDTDIKTHITNHTWETDVKPEDNLYIHTEYEAQFWNGQAWVQVPEILNKIKRTYTTTDLAGTEILKEIIFTYDTKGRILTEKTWLDKPAEDPGPGDDVPTDGRGGRYTLTSQYGYDDYGNIDYSIDKTGLLTDITYDTTYQMYPVQKQTGTFISTSEYDIRSGVPWRSVDPAGMVGESFFDAFFRLTDAYTSTGPNGPADLWLTHINYNLDGAADGHTENYVHQIHNGYESFSYNDGLGRLIQTRIKAETGADGQYRVSNREYNHEGKVTFESLPFFANDWLYSAPFVYKLYVSEDASFSEDEVVLPISAREYASPTLDYATPYHWKVVKQDGQGITADEMGPLTFTTAPAPLAEHLYPENPLHTENGLRYSRVDYPSFMAMADLDHVAWDAEGTIHNFIPNACAGYEPYFALRFVGYLEIPETGQYTFYLASDTVCDLFIGDHHIVHHPYTYHHYQEYQKTIQLVKGKHLIRLDYHHNQGGVTVSYAGPNLSKRPIPDSALFRETASSQPNPPNQCPAVNLPVEISWFDCLPESPWTNSQLGQHYEYDPVGRLVKTTPPDTLEYDPQEEGLDSPTGPSSTAFIEAPYSSVQRFIDPEGKVTEKRFDIAGRVIKSIEILGFHDDDPARPAEDPDDIITTYAYDILGRLVKTTDQNGNEFTAEFDSLGRKIQSSDPDMGIWTYKYDDAGRMLEQVDAKGNKTSFEYNDPELGRVTAKQIYKPGDVLEETISYTYDTSDDPDYTVHKGQVYKVTDGQGWTQTGYDNRGRAIKSTRYIAANGKTYTTQTEYDEADRITKVNYPDRQTVIAYGYDDMGHLTKVESLLGTGQNEVFYESKKFNRFDRPLGKIYGNGVETDYNFYTITNRLKRSHVYIPGGDTLQDQVYKFDKASNIININDQLYAAGDGRNSGLETIVYDDLYRITSAYSPSQQTTLSYTYDALGNMVTNGEQGGSTYIYDGSGHAHSQPHAVTAVGGNSYSYDAVGNMVTRNTTSYGNQTLSYDARNRLIKVEVAGGDTVEFGYSAGDARLWKKVNGTITQLWIGGLYEEKDGRTLCHVHADGELVATFEPQGPIACFIENQPFLAAIWHGTEKATYAVFGGGRAPLGIIGLAIIAGLALAFRSKASTRKRFYSQYLALLSRNPFKQVVLTSLAASVIIAGIPQQAFADGPPIGTVFYYYHADHLGSSSIMTDRDGTVVQHYGYTPFGKERHRESSEAFEVSNRYTGQVLDEEIGLYYYEARYYDAELARFIQADTIVPDPGFSQAFNRYAYVFNNPIKFSDPTGQSPIAFIGAFLKIYGFVGTVRSVVNAAQTGNWGGFLASLALSYIGGSIGGAIGGSIGGELGAAIGGGIGAGVLQAAFFGGDVAEAAGMGILFGLLRYVSKVDPSPGVTDEGASEDHASQISHQLKGGIDIGGTSSDFYYEQKIRVHFGEETDGELPYTIELEENLYVRNYDTGEWDYYSSKSITSGRLNGDSTDFSRVFDNFVDSVKGLTPDTGFYSRFSSEFHNNRLPGAKFFSAAPVPGKFPGDLLVGPAGAYGTDKIGKSLEKAAYRNTWKNCKTFSGSRNFAYFSGKSTKFAGAAKIVGRANVALTVTTTFYTANDIGVMIYSAGAAWRE